MAATETISAQRADSPLFLEIGTRRLTPSPSSTVFRAGSTPPLPSSPKLSPHISAVAHPENTSPSTPSSPETSPRSSSFDFSKTSSFRSTPTSSSLSLDVGTPVDDADEDHIDLPNYDNLNLYHYNPGYVGSAKPPESDADGPGISNATDTTRSDSPLPTPVVADDTMIKQEPSRHVDYLSHNWREEDIWASWRYIVSQRSVYGERSRLENASWRTWAKSKHRLRTVSPEKLNWLKESDVTWLYGPLKPAITHPITSDTSGPESSSISKNSSFVKKPILKKRSVSEVMLQKSLSNSSLVKQAAASVQAQEKKQQRSGMNRVESDLFTSSTLPSNPPSREEVDYFSSRTTTSVDSSPPEGQTQKHLRFAEKVEQCIAVECKDGGLDDESEPEDDPPNSALTESDSDDGLFMLDRKQKPAARKDGSQKGKLSRSNSSTGTMIETLPATTLKPRDSPDIIPEAQQHHVFGKNWGTPKLSPSPSQETLRPSRPSRNFLLADDDDDESGGVDSSSSWSFGRSNPNSSLGASVTPGPSSPPDFSLTDGYDGVEGMRRTESGMFMPYDEDEDDVVAESLFGRVSETINTFRDIGHVLWNVGWRK